MNKVTPFLILNDQLESAIEFYTSTFPDSRVTNVARTGEDGPINSAEFVIGGQQHSENFMMARGWKMRIVGGNTSIASDS